LGENDRLWGKWERRVHTFPGRSTREIGAGQSQGTGGSCKLWEGSSLTSRWGRDKPTGGGRTTGGLQEIPPKNGWVKGKGFVKPEGAKEEVKLIAGSG